MLHYLKFLLKSTNQHGVHSPFIFDYLTKCLYKKPHLSKNKLEDVVLKSVTYFNCQAARIDDQNLKSKLPSLEYDRLPKDVVVFKVLDLHELLKLLVENQIHNGSLIIVQDVRKHLREWKKAVAHPKITVSMDCFTLGILFIRKEQVKEHFTIRL
jgi:hypothetical protein